jgi:putative ABC transport system ATP-binding protein
LLKVKNISKKFEHRRANVTALNDVSFNVSDGDFISITGPSGSGKTTLLLALGGMSAPSAGSVLWQDESIYGYGANDLAKWRSQNVGFVFQTFNLIPYMTVYENIEMALRLAGQLNDSEKKITDLIDKMGLSNRSDHLPSELSVGQQQRVAIARALVKDPKIILADEPTGNLDPKTAVEILDILKTANSEGKTLLLITHDQKIAEMAPKNIKIVDGAIFNG